MFRTNTDRTLDLMQILSFTQEDLDNNRSGRLSPAQRDTMALKKQTAITTGQRAAKGTPFVLIYYIVILSVIAGVFIATGSFQYVQNALGQWAIPVVAGVAVILLLIVATIPRRYDRSVAKYNQSAANMPLDYTVLSIVGELGTKKREVGSNADTPSYISNYYLTIGGKEFLVNQSRHDAVKLFAQKGQPYRLYYAEYGKTTFILSVEPVGNR